MRPAGLPFVHEPFGMGAKCNGFHIEHRHFSPKDGLMRRRIGKCRPKRGQPFA